jgi:hypothetical protein
MAGLDRSSGGDLESEIDTLERLVRAAPAGPADTEKEHA